MILSWFWILKTTDDVIISGFGGEGLDIAVEDCLTISYQIAEDIKIMYHGEVVEEGGVDDVINNPKHPYTQLLINCIPKPDPNEKWIEKKKLQELISNLDKPIIE